MENENWLPARKAWKQFCEANPGLGLSGSTNSFIWFNRTHGDRMIEAGVMRRTISRKLLIDVSRFGQVAFEYLTTGGEMSAVNYPTAAEIKKALALKGLECPDWVCIEAAARLRHETRDWQSLCAEIENAGGVAK